MPGYKGHITGALVAFAVYAAVLAYVVLVELIPVPLDPAGAPVRTLMYSIALLVLAVLFGLWPDVDIDSKGRRIFYGLFLIVDVYLIITGRFEAAAYLGLFAILPAVGKHRGWTHTWWAMLLVPSPLLIVPYLNLPETPWIGLPFYLAAVVGYFSHLLLDGELAPKKLFAWK